MSNKYLWPFLAFTPIGVVGLILSTTFEWDTARYLAVVGGVLSLCVAAVSLIEATVEVAQRWGSK